MTATNSIAPSPQILVRRIKESNPENAPRVLSAVAASSSRQAPVSSRALARERWQVRCSLLQAMS